MKQKIFVFYPESFFYKHYREIAFDNLGFPCCSWERTLKGFIRVEYEKDICFLCRVCPFEHLTNIISKIHKRRLRV